MKKIKGGRIIERKQLINDIYLYKGENKEVFFIDGNKGFLNKSRESEVYKAFNKKTNEEFIAKIITRISPDIFTKDLKNYLNVIAFLKENSRSTKSNLLPLVDSGIINIKKSRFFIEIYPYCKEGSLANFQEKIPVEVLKEKFIPDINKALKEIHDNNFLHRDLKPENIYYYKDSYVLGDFGIMTKTDDKDYVYDFSKNGSLGYMAPELMSGAAVKKSDYYSFGQTIYSLYFGKRMYEDVIRKNLHKEILIDKLNYLMINDIYPGLEKIRDKDASLKELLKGLLSYDPGNRFSYQEVKRWEMGDTILSDKSSRENQLAINEMIKCLLKNELLEEYFEGREEKLIENRIDSEKKRILNSYRFVNKTQKDVKKYFTSNRIIDGFFKTFPYIMLITACITIIYMNLSLISPEILKKIIIVQISY
ncbi:Protein kinase domain-containing protein [Acetitomaculum ruminis DSM 5522]|uniref:Protein kinase domain-containing protein n=1 Tax=Acetitomaculum ruminis DSM 5522 TaxID=1120918 RepID=A0A1I1A3P5_9FIRM|nr:protein kinase [Acetitomaculum ruminis]SFB32644.1 Protein kinase domain-containing protein [Acetitomaculum ruminis DSM 5522]